MIVKGALGASRLRTHLERIEYACREANGSLKPVPAGRTRQELYCPFCTAPNCLFSPSLGPGKKARNKAKAERMRRSQASKRARGLNAKSEPLIESCWNCVHLRMVGMGKYICKWKPDERPVVEWTMRMSPFRRVENSGCELFELRLTMDIPYFPGNKEGE